MEPYGYNGKILRVNLSSRVITEEAPPSVFYRRYVGGGALSLYYLLNELRPGVDPLGPENVLIFAASAVTGHPAAGLTLLTILHSSQPQYFANLEKDKQQKGYHKSDHCAVESICYYSSVV